MPPDRLLRLALPAALATLVLAPTSVLAHAELVETDPPDGGSIVTPHTARATYTEPLNADRSRVEVRDAEGNVVAQGSVDLDLPDTLVVELPALPAGSYTARWIAVGVDGHVVRDSTEFTVTLATPSPEPTVAPTPTAAPRSPSGSAPPTMTPLPLPSATPPPPVAATPPAPGNGDGEQPTAGTADLLIALAVAAIVVAGLFFLLWRRRPA